jgi:hypothetical protein
VEVLDIFVDQDGLPKILFERADGGVFSAPIGRFTELRNGSPPVKKARRRRATDADNAENGQE